MARRGKGKRRSNGGFKLPLAVVAGFAPLASSVYDSRSDGFSGMSNALVRGLTGWDYQGQSWDMGNLNKGLWPILLGFLIHKLASVFGVNRALGRARIPLVRI